LSPDGNGHCVFNKTQWPNCNNAGTPVKVRRYKLLQETNLYYKLRIYKVERKTFSVMVKYHRRYAILRDQGLEVQNIRKEPKEERG